MRSFLGINFVTEQIPDATTLLRFRHLLEKDNIGEKIFTDIKDRLDQSGLLMHGGTIVDATIISAPGSTENRTGTRDPEMPQTKKGHQWYGNSRCSKRRTRTKRRGDELSSGY